MSPREFHRGRLPRNAVAVALATIAASFAHAQSVEVRTVHNDAGQLLAKIQPQRQGQTTVEAERFEYAGVLMTRAERGHLHAGLSTPPAQWGAGFNVQETIDNSYDDLGRLVRTRTTMAGGFTTIEQFSFDAAGRPECRAVRMDPTTFDALPASACTPATVAGAAVPDRITRTEYDKIGRPVAVRAGVGTSTPVEQVRYTYTAAGARETVTDANGNRGKFTYDIFGRRSAWYLPTASQGSEPSTTDKVLYEWDAAGNLTSSTQRDGGRVDFAYDAVNRMTRKSLSGRGRDVIYTYTNMDDVASAVYADGEAGGVYRAYDGYGTPRSERVVRGAAEYTTTYGYDAFGNLATIQYPQGTLVERRVDATGEVSAILAGGRTVAGYQYDPLGRRTRMTLGGRAMTVDYQYGADTQLSQLSLRSAVASGGTDVDFVFKRNQAGQITSRSLTNEVYIDAPVGESQSYGINGLNQYTSTSTRSISWDGNGNLANHGDLLYRYDIEKKLTSAGDLTFAYDPLDRLASVTGSGRRTDYLYVDDQVGVELVNGVVAAQYVQGADDREPVAMIRGSDASVDSYFLADERGSIVLTTDATGWPKAVSNYGAHGAKTSYGTTARFGYGGQLQFPEVGLVHLNARFYSTQLGRFIQTDPIEYLADANLYSYAANDPYNLMDPTGLADQTACPAGSSKTCDDPPVECPDNKCPPQHISGKRQVYVPSEPPPADDIPRLPRIFDNPGIDRFKDCFVDQLGFNDLAAVGMISAGWPLDGSKRFRTPGSSKGTSLAGMAADKVFGKAKFPVRMPTIVGGPGTGTSLRLAYTRGVGRFVGRAVPIVGWGILAYDVYQVARCTLKE